MIINSKKIYPIAEQTGLSFAFNITPNDYSKNIISFQECNNFNFYLESGKFLDANNRSTYFYNSGEELLFSGNINNTNYDYYINDNLISLSGQKTDFKISGVTFSGSNLEVDNFKILGQIPNYEVRINDTFVFGEALSGLVINNNLNNLNFRVLSGNIITPTGFQFSSIPNTIINSGSILINTNLGSQTSALPLSYTLNLNLLTDFGLVSRTFITTGLPNSLTEFFLSLSPELFTLDSLNSGTTYTVTSFFRSGTIERDKVIDIAFTYNGGVTGAVFQDVRFLGSGFANINFNQAITGSGLFLVTGGAALSGYYNGNLVTGFDIGTGYVQTGITGGNYKNYILITGTGIHNAQVYNLNTYVISGYRENILGSGNIVYSGNLTGYISPFSGSGSYTFYSGFTSILNSNARLGILRKNEFFTGYLDYPLNSSGSVKITGFNTTYLDYTGYADNVILTGLLEGSGYIYSAPVNINVTGILRSETENQIITGFRNIQIVDFEINTGINLARIVAIVSGEATGDYTNNPNIFGISTLGTGINVLTGRNFINGSGIITGFNTGYIIKDNFITTGFVSGIVFYLATGDSNNPSNPSNYVQSSYNQIFSGNILYSGFSLDQSLTFTGTLANVIKFTGNIDQFGILYSEPTSLTGLNTISYTSYSGVRRTGVFTKISNNLILQKNTYFTGEIDYARSIYSTGISSGENDTYFYWEEVSAPTNKTFTGIILSGSGNLITSPEIFLSPVSASGILSGQVGTGINYITISETVLNPHVTEITDVFFTGEKKEIREVIVSGLASGTKYNFIGIEITGSGYANSIGSGILTGSGYINITGYGVFTGVDGSLLTGNVTGSSFVILTGNPNNISDPINIVKLNQIIFTTGTGFFSIFNRNITGTAVDPVTLSGILNIKSGSGVFLVSAKINAYSTGDNIYEIEGITPKYRIFSGYISDFSRTGNLFFTGISDQFINASPFSGVGTGLNNTLATNVQVDLQSPVVLSGYITLGTGLVSTVINTGFYALLPDSIKPTFANYFTGRDFEFSLEKNATGFFQITGLITGFTGAYTGLFYEFSRYIPFYETGQRFNFARNLVQFDSDYDLTYRLETTNAYDYASPRNISGIDILNISGKENIFIVGSFTGLTGFSGLDSLIRYPKYYILPKEAGGSGILSGLFENLTGIIGFRNDNDFINKVIYTDQNYLIFVGDFRNYIIPSTQAEVPTNGAIAINLTGKFISNWTVEQNNNAVNASKIEDIVYIDKNKVLLGGDFNTVSSTRRNSFAMINFGGDENVPPYNLTLLSGLDLKLYPGYQVNSILYYTGEPNNFYVLGNFPDIEQTGYTINGISANLNRLAQPKILRNENPLILKSNFEGEYERSSHFYYDYIGIEDYGYNCLEFDKSSLPNQYIKGYRKNNNDYYFYGKFNNVGSRFRKGFAAFDSTSGFIKNANVNLEGDIECLESSGDYVFVGGSIRGYGGLVYGIVGNDSEIGGYALKDQLTIDRTFPPIVPVQENGPFEDIYDIKRYNDKIYVVGNFEKIRLVTGYNIDANSSRRTSFAVFDLSGNLLPEALHFTFFAGDYKTNQSLAVNTLFITGSTGYFGGGFECVVGDGLESNLPDGVTRRYSGYRMAAFNLDTLHPITGFTGHFSEEPYQIAHFTGDYLIAVGQFDTYHRPYGGFSKTVNGACVFNRFDGTGIFESGACPTITGGGFIANSSSNNLRGYYRRPDNHYYLYGSLLRQGSNNNLGIMLFNGSGIASNTNSIFESVIQPNSAATGFRFLLETSDTSKNIRTVLENENDLMIGGFFSQISGKNSPFVKATGLAVIDKNNGTLINTGISLGRLAQNGGDSSRDTVYDIQRHNNKIFVGGVFLGFKAAPDQSLSGMTAGRLAVFDLQYNLERSLASNLGTSSSTVGIYTMLSDQDRIYVAGNSFGLGDYRNQPSLGFSVQSPRYYDIGGLHGEVGRFGLIQLNRSGYELPQTPINLSGVYLNARNEKINVIKKHESGLFLGGNFTSINGIPRTGLAWIGYDCSIKDWQPYVIGHGGGLGKVEIKDIILSGDSILFVGHFNRVNGLNRAGAAQVKITGLGQSTEELSNFNNNSSYGISTNYVNVIYNDDLTNAYYLGGNFNNGLIKVNKDTLNVDATLNFQITPVQSGVRAFNRLNDNYFIGGNFDGFTGNSNIYDFVVFKFSGAYLSGTLDFPKLSISNVSDIQIHNEDIYVIPTACRGYKFNIDETEKKLKLNNSWTPFFSSYLNNNFNTYIQPSRAKKILITGNNIFTVGNFSNVSYYRKNIFKTDLSGKLKTGMNLEFNFDPNTYNVDNESLTSIEGIGFDKQNNTIFMAGPFTYVNNIISSGFVKVDLETEEILRSPYGLSSTFGVTDIETTSDDKMTIVGDFYDLSRYISGGNYVQPEGFYFRTGIITGMVIPATGALTLTSENSTEGIYNNNLKYTGILPETLKYTGISGYNNASGTIVINFPAQINNKINIYVEPEAQFAILNSNPLIPLSGINFHYKTSFNKTLYHFSNIEELYDLVTGSVVSGYVNAEYSSLEDKLYLYPKISGTSGNSGIFDITQSGESFTIQNFSGGMNKEYVTDIYSTNITGILNQFTRFTGTGYYEAIQAAQLTPASNIRVTTTGLWLVTGYHVYSSGVTFVNINSGKILYTGRDIKDYSYSVSNDIKFYSKNTTGDLLYLYNTDATITGFINRRFTGSGIMTGFLTGFFTGQMYQSSGYLRYRTFKTGFNEFIITGGHLDYNNLIGITGRFLNIDNINTFFTGVQILEDVNSLGYVGRVVRTGIANINGDILFDTSFESQKTFIATGSVEINSGIIFLNADQGKRQITGNLITGSGFVTLPNDVYPISDIFTGLYNIASTGTGFMLFTGERKHGGIARVTGENNFITSGYINLTGKITFDLIDSGSKNLNIVYTGEPDTGTLIPLNTLNKNAWSIKSGFNHIGDDFSIILGSGDMTGYFTDTFSLTSSTGISGNLEYLARFTGIFSGLVTGFRESVSESVADARTIIYNTLPYNINTGQVFITNIIVNQTLTRTGIFNFTGSSLSTGLYRSKTNFIITGISTGYFPITGTGIVNLSGYITLEKSLTNFINYPYPSGNSIAYLILTGLDNFTGYFISGVKITGLYTKSYTNLFSGSASGHYTGTWSGTGLFTGYQQITFDSIDSGKKNVNISQTLVNDGFQNGLVPVYNLGLYSGLRTIENINYNQNVLITGSGYMEKIISGFALAGVTSGSGLALLTGYLSGLLDKNYSGTINYETGILLTGFGINTNLVLTGLFTGTVIMTGNINRNLNILVSGTATGEYIDIKTFTGSFDVSTGSNTTGEFIKINPTPSGYYINRLVPTGENLLVNINYNQNIDQISGNLRIQVYTGLLTGSVINNTIYGTRL